MSFLQSEVLLAIFKNLDSKEILNIRTVSQFWFQVIDENKTLWRSLNPPVSDCGDRQRHNEEVGDDEEEFQDEDEERVLVREVSTVDLFDRKSQSSLEEVSMDGSDFCWQDLGQLVEILSRSKETLRILNLSTSYVHVEFLNLSWRLPHLVDCRLLSQRSVNKIRLTPKMPLVDERNHYKVLWIFSCQKLFQSHLYLLENLVSLKEEVWKKGSEWRVILDKPSRTLKHLTIKVALDYGDNQLSNLLFSALQVLEIKSEGYRFPSWLKISHSAFTLIQDSKVLSSLPSISALWVNDPTTIKEVTDQCPELMILRANVKGPSREERERRGSPSAAWTPTRSLAAEQARRADPGAIIIQELEKRKKNVEDGMQIDGIKMKQIKTLIVPFEALYREELEELRGLVEEVIDLKTSARFVEVEI